MTDPRVILIGGVPGTGKTTLASAVARRTGVNLVFGGDLLREFLRGVLPPSQAPVLFESVYNCWKVVSSTPTPAAVVEGFVRQGEVVNRGVVRMVRRSLADGESMVLEYIHLLPGQLREVLDQPGVAAFLSYVDSEALHRERLRARGASTHRRSDPQRLVDQLPHYRILQDHLRAEALRAGIPELRADALRPDELVAEVLARLGSRSAPG